jgi:hypothetical protein
MARLKPRAQGKGSVAADGRVDKKLGESLRLRLGTDENADAEHDADQAEKQRAFAVRRKTQRNVKRRGHGFGRKKSTRCCRTGSPGRSLS